MFGNLLAIGSVSAMVWMAGIFFIVLCVFLIAIVLLQKGRGDGLSSALGGAGGQSAFGSKTGDKLTVFTIIVVVVFFIFAIGLSLGFKPKADPSEVKADTTLKPNTDAGSDTTEQPKEEAEPAKPAETENPAPVETKTEDTPAEPKTE
ncbi:MAG: preprotein translocase subunit SecG [Phycisphaerae bacterium]|nr:preprotein translocase subunit SecG [Phycisphaerae bacterium]